MAAAAAAATVGIMRLGGCFVEGGEAEPHWSQRDWTFAPSVSAPREITIAGICPWLGLRVIWLLRRVMVMVRVMIMAKV